MLVVTEAARDVLGQILANSEPEQEQALRLTKNERDEFGLALDQARHGDQVVVAGSQPVLVIDDGLADELHGVMLDAAPTPDGPSLRMVITDAPPSQNGSTPG